MTALHAWDVLLGTDPQSRAAARPPGRSRAHRAVPAAASAVRLAVCARNASSVPAVRGSALAVCAGRAIYLPLRLVTDLAAGNGAPTWAAMPPRPLASPPLLACVPVVQVMAS